MGCQEKASNPVTIAKRPTAHREQTVARSLFSMKADLLDNAVAVEVLGVGLTNLEDACCRIIANSNSIVVDDTGGFSRRGEGQKVLRNRVSCCLSRAFRVDISFCLEGN